MKFHSLDENFLSRVKESFLRQRVMQTIGAEITHIALGEVDISLPFHIDLTQQNNYLHAGIVSTIVDSACGYAAYTLMPATYEVLTTEFKINLLAPAKGEAFLAQGRVLKSGRTLSVVRGDVLAQQQNEQKLIATMLATVMGMAPR